MMIAVAGIGIYLVWYSLPKSVAWDMTGIKYQLGTSGTQQIQSVPITIKGILKRNLTGSASFKGFIDLKGVTLPIPESSRKLTVTLDKRDGSPMVYDYYDENHYPRTYSLGVIYADDDFSKFTILFTNSADGGWDSENGKMLSAPAFSREEALKIANELMRERLGDRSLQ